MTRRIVMGLLVTLAVLIGTALIGPSFVDWNQYKQPALEAAEKATGYKISVNGPLRLSVLPFPQLHVEQVTVALPEVKDANLAKLDRLNVVVALLPLLSGKVNVTSVDLVRPDIRITLDAQGTPDWMTSQIKDSMTGSGGAPEKSAVSISVDTISINDGRFVLTDMRNRKIHEAKNIDADLTMTLPQGLLRARGSLTYRDVKLDFHAAIDKIAGDDVPAKLTLVAKDFDTSFSFAGAMKPRAPYEAQGQLEAEGKKWVDVMMKFTGQAIPVPPLPFELNALLSATEHNVTLDNLKFSYGDLGLTGSVKARLADNMQKKPFVEAKLASKDALKIGSLMAAFASAPPGKAEKQTSGLPAVSMPKIALPIDLDATVNAPALRLAHENFKDISLEVDAKGDNLKIRFKAAQVPGQGTLDVAAYPGAGGALMADMKMDVQDAVKFTRGGLGMDIPVGVPLEKFRNLKLATGLTISSTKVEARAGTLSWQGGDLSFSGSAYEPRVGGQPFLTLTLGGKRLNLDDLTGAKTPVKEAPIKETLATIARGLKLPMDIDAALSFGELVTGGKTVQDLTLAATLKGNRLDIGNLDIGAYEGVALKARGVIPALDTLADMNVKASIEMPDVDATIKKFALPTPVFARPIGGGAVDIDYKGSLDKANVVIALRQNAGFKIGLAGAVTSPLDMPKMDKLKTTVAHPNTGEAIAFFRSGFKPSDPLRAPLNLSADLTASGKAYKAENLSGQVGRMDLVGNLTADYTSTTPAFSGALTLGDVPLDALMGDAGGASQKAAPTARGTQWSSAPLDAAWMKGMTLDFTVLAKSLTYNLWTLDKPGFSMTLKNGTLAVPDLKAGLFGGQIIGSGQMKAADDKTLSMSGQGTMKDVNVRSLTNALVGRADNRFDGMAGMELSLTSAGTSPAEIVRNLVGHAASTGNNIAVNGLDVPKLVGWLSTDLKPSTALSGLSGAAFGSGSTVFEKHDGKYVIQNGLVNIENMIFDGVSASLVTTGSVSLPQWAIDTKSTLQVKGVQGAPPLTFSFRGSLDNPGRNIGQGLLENYLKSKVEKKVEKLIEKKLGDKLQDLGILPPAQPVPEAAPAPEPIIPGGPYEPEPALIVPQAAPQPTPAPAPQEIKPEDVLKGVLQELVR